MHPQLVAWLDTYAGDHRHPMNRLTHKVAIPVIVFHVMAMLAWIPLGAVGGVALNGGMLGTVVGGAWYLFYAGPKLGLIMTASLAAATALGMVTPAPVVVIAALVGWVVQLAGHAVWEKAAPSFVKNLLQALVGPVFFVAALTGDLPASSRARLAA